MDDGPKDPTTAFAEELAKQLPVKAAYRDAVKPAAKQTGQLALDIVKTIQLALAPLQFAGAYQDRLRAFIDRSVRAVPEANRVSPPPQILGPIVEGIRYEPEGTPLDEMFSELLSSSMDTARCQHAHPAFVATIRSLSSDEAIVLAHLTEHQIEQVLWSSYDQARNFFEFQKFEKVDAPAELTFPENINLFLEHLAQLGLLEIVPIKSEPTYEAGAQNGLRIHRQYRLSGWGRQFMRACQKP